MTEHKHAEVLRAIADGKEVECRPKGYYGNVYWFTPTDILNPIHRPDYEWRVKPEPKPDVVRFCFAKMDAISPVGPSQFRLDNLCLTFDGETGKLKSVEVLI